MRKATTKINDTVDVQEYINLKKDYVIKKNASVIIENSFVSPFRWFKNAFICFFCENKYTEPKELREHTSFQHSNTKVMPFTKSIKKYDLIKVDVSYVGCKLCTNTVTDLDDLKNHLTSIHAIQFNPSYNDGLLPFKFDSDMFYCYICDSQFNVFITLNNHMNSHLQNFICPTCGKGFATSKRLQSHNYSHVVGSFACNFCNSIFPSNAMKTNHTIRYHKEAKQFKCPQCPEYFKSYLDRNKHRRTIHNVTSLEYKCPLCPKIFSLSGKRTNHIKQVHVREKKHACAQCEWKFYSRTELQKHMIKHTGQRIHQCDMCNKAFARKHTLNQHLRTHNEER